MSHDVFISFSSDNTNVAEKVIAALEESGGIKCWIAYRDIVPSANYAEQLVEAIESCKLVLLILSDDSNKSPQVSREIERAGSKGIPILPLRIEDVVLSKSMEYFISSHHWLDAYEGDIEEYLPALRTAVESTIRGKGGKAAGTDVSTRKSTRKPTKKGSETPMILAAGLVLAILVAAIFFLKPHTGRQEKEIADNLPTVTKIPVTAQPVSEHDTLIRELATRYRENKTTPKVKTDSWTSSPPPSIAFLDVTGSGVNSAETDFIVGSIGDKLVESRRFTVVEREMIDKLLKELNLSSSELADPSTSLKLGRILSARVIVTGSISKQDKQWLANLRFIDTETTAIKCSVSVIVDDGGPADVINELDKAINRKLKKEFPLQAKIASISDNNASINIGADSGVAKGMIFDILMENDMPLDAVTVTNVSSEKSQIALARHSTSITRGMRLREKLQE